MVRSTKALLGLTVLFCLESVAFAGPTAAQKELKRREQMLSQLEDARKAALEAIGDTLSYRDEDHGASGQKHVDAKVAKVREIWTVVAPLLDKDVTTVLKAKPAKREAFLAQHPDELSGWENAVRRRFLDLEVMKKNDTVAKAAKDAVVATDVEREQIRHTNEYRMLLGRRALAIDTRLVASARGHSIEMVKLRYFAHESPTEGRRRPADRMAKQGVVDVATGENIAYGYDTAKAAFEGWYTSAGHHRNMLDAEYVAIGVGREKDYWTQNFAGAPSSNR